jgi:hypothetical protein
MTGETVDSRTADADRLLPADGLRLLGQYQDSGYAGRRFLVGRSDGQVFQLPLLLYLIMAAVAEGGVDGGWSADQVGARVGAASGQRLSADTVRYLIAGKLAPLGLIAAHGDSRPEPGPPATRAKLLPGLKFSGAQRRDGADGQIGRTLFGPVLGRVKLLLRHSRRHWTLAFGATAVLASVAASAPMMAGTGNKGTGGTRPASATATSWSQAAAWVAQQVSPSATVSCDPGMCAQLRRDGFPAAHLKPLPRGSRVLHGTGSGILVATPAVRSQFDPHLTSAYAPQVIASFGSGAARVDVCTVASVGAKAFRTELTAAQTELASAGRQLLGNRNIQASASARAALRAGQVDARLLTILALLAAQLPVRLAGFTGAPGAGPGVLLRSAEIGVASPAARSAVVALLDAQQSPYRPTVTAVAHGSRSVVALRFDAPASLDISQP